MKNIFSQKQIAVLSRVLKSYSQIVAGYIFGSRVKGTDLPKSDLDLALVCFRKEGLSPIIVIDRINRIISGYKLDITIVDLDDDPIFFRQVLQGQVIYQKNLYKRVELETRMLQIYEDNKFLTRIKNYYLDKSFKEGIYAV